MVRLIYAVVALCLLTVTGNAVTAKRVALVVGVSQYQNTPPLPNPVHDSVSVAALLESLGFKVLHYENVDQTAFGDALSSFEEALQGAEVALFYFAGHGMQMDGQNYLLSANARVQNPHLIDTDGMRLDRILSLMEDRADISIALVDSCRDNPLADLLRRKSGGAGRSLGLTRGLARIENTSQNTLVAFATAPGTVALDGTEPHSPFAQALLAHLADPGIEISAMLKRVTNDVLESTGHSQRPEVVASMDREFYFVEAKVEVSGTVTVDNATGRENAATDLLNAARSMSGETQRLAALQLVASRYPETAAAEIAKMLANEIVVTEAAKTAATEEGASSATAPQPFDSSQLARLDPAGAGTVDQSGQSTASPADTEAGLGLSDEDYKRVQLALNTLGYEVGTEDGVFGDQSRKGLRKFQIHNQVEESGYLTQETLAALLKRFDETPKTYDGLWDLEVHRYNYNPTDPIDWNGQTLIAKAQLRLRDETFYVVSNQVFSTTKPLFDTFTGRLTNEGALSVDITLDYHFGGQSDWKPVHITGSLPRYVSYGRNLEIKGPILERGRERDDAVWAKLELKRVKE